MVSMVLPLGWGPPWGVCAGLDLLPCPVASPGWVGSSGGAEGKSLVWKHALPRKSPKQNLRRSPGSSKAIFFSYVGPIGVNFTQFLYFHGSLEAF